jgi:hypothetical protein
VRPDWDVKHGCRLLVGARGACRISSRLPAGHGTRRRNHRLQTVASPPEQSGRRVAESFTRAGRIITSKTSPSSPRAAASPAKGWLRCKRFNTNFPGMAIDPENYADDGAQIHGGGVERVYRTLTGATLHARPLIGEKSDVSWARRSLIQNTCNGVTPQGRHRHRRAVLLYIK